MRLHIKALKAEIEALKSKLAASEAREKETQQLLKEALEKIEYLTRKLFGRSTEARVVEGQLTMDILNEVEVIADREPLGIAEGEPVGVCPTVHD